MTPIEAYGLDIMNTAIHGVHLFKHEEFIDEPVDDGRRYRMFTDKNVVVQSGHLGVVKAFARRYLDVWEGAGRSHRDLPSLWGVIVDDTDAVSHRMCTNGRIARVTYLGHVKDPRIATRPLHMETLMGQPRYA